MPRRFRDQVLVLVVLLIVGSPVLKLIASLAICRINVVLLTVASPFKTQNQASFAGYCTITRLDIVPCHRCYVDHDNSKTNIRLTTDCWQHLTFLGDVHQSMSCKLEFRQKERSGRCGEVYQASATGDIVL